MNREKADYKAMDSATITTAIEAKKKQLVKLSMSHAVEPLKNPRKITQTRREIARALTAYNQKNKPVINSKNQ